MKNSRFLKRLFPLLLAFVMLFGSSLTVFASGVDDVVGSKNQYNIVWQNYPPDGDICDFELYTDAEIYFFFDNPDSTFCVLYVYFVGSGVLTYGTTLNGSAQYGGISNKLMYSGDILHLDASRSGLEVLSYSDNVMIFSDKSGLESYLDSGDLSGLLYGGGSLSGGTGGNTGSVTDELLDGIWGGIVDEEVKLEEDDGTVLGVIRTWIRNLSKMISSPLDTIKTLMKKLPSAFLGVWVNSDWGQKVVSMYEVLLDLPEMVFAYFWNSDFGQFIRDIYSSLVAIPLAIFNSFWESDFGTTIREGYTFLLTLPETVFRAFWNSDFGNAIKDIVKGILDIPENVGAKIKDVFTVLFVPDDDFFKDEFALLLEKTAFVWQIVDLGNDLFTGILTGTVEPPTFTIHLRDIVGQRYGTQDVVIDFAWYEPYKPFGDALLSAVFWLTFVWNVFIHLPSIISGGGGAITNITGISEEIEKNQATGVKKHYWEL